MNKIEKLDRLLDVVKAKEELGLAKAKSLIGEVKNVDFPEIPVPDFFKKEEVVVEKKKFNWGEDDFEDEEFDDDDFFEDDDK